jgi:CRP/FNR family transcriptional regulator
MDVTAQRSQAGSLDSGAPADVSAAPHDATPHDRYRVVSIPSTDILFRHTVVRQARSVRQRGATLRAAQRSLRRRYPHAELSRQRDCRVDGQAVEVWFAYRDGRAEAVAPQDSWRDDRGVARVVVDSSGRLVRANAASRRLLELPAARTRTITVRDLLSRELYQEVALESRRRPARGDWVGAVPLRLASGRRVDVEFSVRADATRQRYEIALRSLADRDRANDWTALALSALGSVPTAVVADLFRDGVRRKLGSGERLAASLADDAWVVLITAGVMRLYVAMDGYEPTLAYGSRSSLFGTHVFVANEPFLLGLQAVTPSVIVQLSTRRMGELAKSKPTFARALSGDVQVQLREVVRSFAAHAAGDLPQRLAREIVALSELHADDGLLPVTEQQLADGIGSIRESVGRSIGDLRRAGLVATSRHGLLILDEGGLREAGGSL